MILSAVLQLKIHPVCFFTGYFMYTVLKKSIIKKSPLISSSVLQITEDLLK